MNEQRQLFWVWCDMRYRCNNPKHRAYANYGGRGIRVCERWSKFKNFLDDMGARPRGSLLERIDNNGNYDPNNCRWANRKDQNSNRRNCIHVTDGGEQITLKEFCRRRGLKYRAIMKRVRDRNWPLDEALLTPIPGKRKPGACTLFPL